MAWNQGIDKMIYLLNAISTLNHDFVMIKLSHYFCQDYQQEYKAFQNHGKKPFEILVHSKNIVSTIGRFFLKDLLHFLHLVEHGASLNTPCSSRIIFLHPCPHWIYLLCPFYAPIGSKPVSLFWFYFFGLWIAFASYSSFWHERKKSYKTWLTFTYFKNMNHVQINWHATTIWKSKKQMVKLQLPFHKCHLHSNFH